MNRLLIKILFSIILTATVSVAFSQKTITGMVYDDSHQPLIGASISVKGTPIMTLSKSNGSYSLTVPPEHANDSIEVRYVGFVSQKFLPTDSNHDVYFEAEGIKAVEVIVVSTQKRLQSSLEVPIAITAFDQNRLDELYATQIDEISGYVSGFNNIIQGQNKAGYSIRGVTSDGMESFFQPRISVFLNNISVSREQVSALEPFDIERIEVVKGPQGTLFGRGAEIGAVHFITKHPVNMFSANLRLNYGGYNQRGAQGYVNLPISEKVADRLAFSYDYHDGYIKNLAGGSLNGKNAFAIRNTLSIRNNYISSLSLILDFQMDDAPGVSFKSKKIAPIGGDTSPFTAAYLNQGKHLGLVRQLGGATVEFERKLNDRLYITNNMGARGAYADEYFDGDGTYLYLLEAREMAKQMQFSEEFRLNWRRGSRLSGFVGMGALYEYCEHYMNIHTDLGILFPSSVAPSIKASLQNLPTQVSTGVQGGIEAFKQQLVSQYPAEYADQISQNLDEFSAAVCSQIESAMAENLDTWFQGNEWSNTPDFFTDTRNTVQGVLVSTLDAVIKAKPEIAMLLNGMTAEQVVGAMDIESGLSDLKPLSNLQLERDYIESHSNYTHNFETDIFADVTWNIVKKLYLTLGLRTTYERQKTGYESNSMTAPIVGYMVYKNSGGKTYWIDDDNFSWVGRVVFNYMLDRFNNVYLSVAKGRRPGVVYFNYTPDKPIRLRPEEIYSYELGFKGNIFKNTLSYAAAAYYYKWQHFQSSAANTAENGALEYINNDKGIANCYGAELSLKYYCKRFVTLFGDYTYFNGKFADKDEDGNPLELAGHSFRLAPDHAIDFGADFEFPIKSKCTLYFRPNYTYKSKHYFEDSNKEDISQDGCGIVNATLGVRFSKKRLSYDFGFWGKNITDTEYLIDAGNAGETIGFPTFVAGAPANFGVKLSVTFR